MSASTYATEQALMNRLLATQTPLGRWKLRAYWRLKRTAWAIVVGGTQFMKRSLDLVVSIIVILLSSPVLLLIALLVKLDGGPIFFRQTRVGHLGREFGMLKFRSMCVDAEAKLAALLAQNEKGQGVTFKMKNDPRITRIGRFIRKTSLDEMPQLFNVLLGDMSLVGPRPPVPREVALYSMSDRRRFLVKPGLTCLWQVGERNGGLFEIGDRNAIDFTEQVSLDVRYIENQSIWRDLWLLAKTVPAVLLGKGM
jgi:lipopolysaccharide/colanic/teichoic acid biosynthesis glycosyltransferase